LRQLLAYDYIGVYQSYTELIVSEYDLIVILFNRYRNRDRIGPAKVIVIVC